MKIIGITGGIGTGKSKVLCYLKEEFHAVVYQADEIAHQLQEPGHFCYKQIIKLFGTSVLHDNKVINRGELGNIVFKDHKKLLQLNDLLHPAVKRRVRELIEAEANAGTNLFILEAALLIEEEYIQLCDELWYIYATEETRRSRLRETRNYSEQKINEIIKAQLKESVFRSKCHRIIDNNGTFESTCKQIKDVIYEIM